MSDNHHKNFLLLTSVIIKGMCSSPLCVGVFGFITTMFLLQFVAEQIWGPITCRDGWHSSSIGTQGACSHHGGVDGSRGAVIFIISISFSILIGKYWNGDYTFRDVLSFLKNFPEKKDIRPISPYGSKEKHRQILLSSGASIETVEEILSQFSDQ